MILNVQQKVFIAPPPPKKRNPNEDNIKINGFAQYKHRLKQLTLTRNPNKRTGANSYRMGLLKLIFRFSKHLLMME